MANDSPSAGPRRDDRTADGRRPEGLYFPTGDGSRPRGGPWERAGLPGGAITTMANGRRSKVTASARHLGTRERAAEQIRGFHELGCEVRARAAKDGSTVL